MIKIINVSHVFLPRSFSFTPCILFIPFVYYKVFKYFYSSLTPNDRFKMTNDPHFPVGGFQFHKWPQGKLVKFKMLKFKRRYTNVLCDPLQSLFVSMPLSSWRIIEIIKTIVWVLI